MEIIKSYPEGTKRKLQDLCSGTVIICSPNTYMILKHKHDGKCDLAELTSGYIMNDVDLDTYVIVPQSAKLHITI